MRLVFLACRRSTSFGILVLLGIEKMDRPVSAYNRTT